MVSWYQGIDIYVYLGLRHCALEFGCYFIIWDTGKPARWFWRNLYGRENFRILGSVWSPFFHFTENFTISWKTFPPVQVWIYLMVPDLGLRRRTLLDQPNIPNRKIPFGPNVRWNLCSMEKIKSPILFRKFYLCHTSTSELFIVYDHHELDKNWTNRNRVFHGTFSWNI